MNGHGNFKGVLMITNLYMIQIRNCFTQFKENNFEPFDILDSNKTFD